jgi:hypothetical protein
MDIVTTKALSQNISPYWERGRGRPQSYKGTNSGNGKTNCL